MPHITTWSSSFTSNAIEHPQHQQADGFKKLGDIKGELDVFAPINASQEVEPDALISGGRSSSFEVGQMRPLALHDSVHCLSDIPGNANAMVLQEPIAIGRPPEPEFAPEWFAPGSAVESIDARNVFAPQADQMLSPLGGEGVFT